MDTSQSFWLLSPNAMGFVPASLMQVIILVTLLTWKQKSRATWLLIGWQITLGLLLGCFLAAHSIYAPLAGYVYWMGCITFAWLSTAMSIQFAYYFPRLIYPREARLVLVLSLVLTAAFVVLMIVEAINEPGGMSYGFAGFYYEFLGSTAESPFASVRLFDSLFPATFLWPAFVWLRQCVHFSPDGSDQSASLRWTGFSQRWWRRVVGSLWAPSSNDARTARMMALVLSVALLSPIASMLEERSLVPVGTFAASFLIAKAVFFLVYLDYAPEPMTVRLKFVAVSLVTMMLMIGLFAPLMLKWTQQFYHEARQDEISTVKHLLAHDITNQMPDRVLYVATRPASGGLFASSYQMLFSRTATVNAQVLREQDAHLHALTRHTVSAVSWRNLLRVYPWLRTQFSGIPTSQQLAQLSIPEGVVSYRGHVDPPERHIIRYTFQLDAHTLAEVGYSYPAYRQMLHTRAVPLVWVTLAAIPIVLLLVPFFIKVSLIQPLAAFQEGIRRVETGDLHTTVPVRVADEIGFLATAFNRMVASLRFSRTSLLHEIDVRQQKEHELSILTTTLEQRVTERTHELMTTNQHLEQEMLERQQAEQRALEQERAITMLHERERLARELHDSLGQVLGYVNTQTQAMRDLLKRNEVSPALHLLDQLVVAVQRSSMDIRDYIMGVQVGTTVQPSVPDMSPSTSLKDTIAAYVTQFRQLHRIEASLSIAPGLTDMQLSPTLELHLLRIVQEALTNVRKHAQATRVLVSVSRTHDTLRISIIDDGCGFQPSDSSLLAQPNGSGYGLTSMRGRVADIGGTLEIESAPDAGTCVHVTVPLRRQGDILRHPLRLLLVDDNELFLQGLHNLLTVRGFQVVGTASNGYAAQAQARNLQPDVILMDVQMPNCDGLEATRAIKAILPDIQIVMLTVSDDDTHLFEAIKLGATGYLLKSLEGDDLCAMLLGLRQGEAPLSPGLAARILREFATSEQAFTTIRAAGDAPDMLLSPEQIELLGLLAQGFTQRDIGEHLGYTERTIRRHMAEIIAALHLKNRAEAIDYARRKLEQGEWPVGEG